MTKTLSGTPDSRTNQAVLRLLTIATVLAAVTIVFGAYVRLTDAGLGCPDWPGCYGRLLVPESAAELPANDPNLAARPLETGKAWREMIHRYLASTLGLVILAAVIVHLVESRRGTPLRPSFLLLAPLVCFQGALGMWTVTLLLKPLVVAAHLMGGMSILGLLWWNLLRERALGQPTSPRPTRHLVRFALVVLVMQIALGGWTSTNYAALACADFPTCHGTFAPPMDFANGFRLWHGLGINYEYGILDAPARIAIHYTHRVWALITALVLVITAVSLWRAGSAAERRNGTLLAVALGAQLSLGVLNIIWQLPLPVAVAHNAGAAALLAVTVLSLATASGYATSRAPRAFSREGSGPAAMGSVRLS
jgi:cytochrome c oxidase assembly protein subunit 15